MITKHTSLVKVNILATFIEMSEITFNYYPQFLTATILEWKHLLVVDNMKDNIISSVQFLIKEGRVKIYGLVLMSNHIHLIGQILDEHEKAKVQQSFLKYTAQQMKFALANEDTTELKNIRLKQVTEHTSFGNEIH